MEDTLLDKIEGTPLGWATLDDILTILASRYCDEPIVFIRGADFVVSDNCKPEELFEIAKALARYAKKRQGEV